MAKRTKKDTAYYASLEGVMGTGHSRDDGRLLVKVPCSRCGGSGHHSSCQMYGTRCFQCDVASGGARIGWEWVDAKKYDRRLTARMRRETKRQAEWEAGAEERERRKAEYEAAQAEREAQAAVHREAMQAKNRWVLEALEAVPYRSDFVESMVQELQRRPLAELSERQQEIIQDIWTKQTSDGARRNSKAYKAAALIFETMAAQRANTAAAD